MHFVSVKLSVLNVLTGSSYSHASLPLCVSAKFSKIMLSARLWLLLYRTVFDTDVTLSGRFIVWLRTNLIDTSATRASSLIFFRRRSCHIFEKEQHKTAVIGVKVRWEHLSEKRGISFLPKSRMVEISLYIASLTFFLHGSGSNAPTGLCWDLLLAACVKWRLQRTSSP